MPGQIPVIGDIVRYTLSEQDAEQINRRRADAVRHLQAHPDHNDGSQLHTGNSVKAGKVYPMVITRVWYLDTPGSACNGQVLLDGNDTLWVTSVTPGEGERHFTWPVR